MKKSHRLKMSFRIKVALFVCAVSLILISLGIGLGYFRATELMGDMFGEDHSELANILSVSVSEMIDREINNLQRFSDNPFWKEGIQTGNSKYEGRDDEAIQSLRSHDG